MVKKLNEELVKKIYESTKTYRELSREHSLEISTLTNIKRRLTHKEVTKDLSRGYSSRAKKLLR